MISILLYLVSAWKLSQKVIPNHQIWIWNFLSNYAYAKTNSQARFQLKQIVIWLPYHVFILRTLWLYFPNSVKNLHASNLKICSKSRKSLMGRTWIIYFDVWNEILIFFLSFSISFFPLFSFVALHKIKFLFVATFYNNWVLHFIHY